MSDKRSNLGGRLSLVTSEEAGTGSLLDSSGVVGSGESEYALLRAGKIDIDEYMELSVERAVAHLEGQLPLDQVEAMRAVLLDSLRNDPQLSTLVAQAAG